MRIYLLSNYGSNLFVVFLLKRGWFKAIMILLNHGRNNIMRFLLQALQLSFHVSFLHQLSSCDFGSRKFCLLELNFLMDWLCVWDIWKYVEFLIISLWNFPHLFSRYCTRDSDCRFWRRFCCLLYFKLSFSVEGVSEILILCPDETDLFGKTFQLKIVRNWSS